MVGTATVDNGLHIDTFFFFPNFLPGLGLACMVFCGHFRDIGLL